MSALDVGARGIALQARQMIERGSEGTVSIGARSAPTAAAIEALALDNPVLTGAAGISYPVETTPYINRDRLVIRGNGAEIRNVNPTSLSVDHTVLGAMALGGSLLWSTDWLTYYNVLSASGPVLNLAGNEGANFAPGDMVVLHGATQYYVASDYYYVYRNYTRARVIAATSTTITIDRNLPAQLLADSPVIGNVAEAAGPDYDLPLPFYLLHAPHISNLRLSSDLGDALLWGGVVDGTIRDLEIEGRNGMVLGAMQDCLIENIRFRAWRKICELAEGSVGTTVRNFRGSLSDASTRNGGASDAPPFFIGLSENASQCTYENFDVNSGPNDTVGGGSAVIFGSGRNNELRSSVLRFPAHTSSVLAIQANPAAGHPNVDCGFRNLTVFAPVCSQFFACFDGGGGITRPYLTGSRFYGTPTTRAALLNGNQGRMTDTFFEQGRIEFSGATATGWRVEGNTADSITLNAATNNVIRGNYLRNGFNDLTAAKLKLNTIEGNESDASRRLDAAAFIVSANSSVTATTANTAFGSATFAPGDLAAGDKVSIYSKANSSSAGTTNRTCRLSITSNGSTTGAGSRVVNAPSVPVGMAGEIEILSDTFIVCDFRIGETRFHNTMVVPSIATYGLTVNLEYWVASASEPINVRGARIIPIKLGMKYLPLT